MFGGLYYHSLSSLNPAILVSLYTVELQFTISYWQLYCIVTWHLCCCWKALVFALIISSSSASIGCTLTDRGSSIWFCWGGAGVASTVDKTQEVSLSPTDWIEILQGGEEVFRIFARGPALRPLVIMSGSEGLLELVNDCLTFFCSDTLNLPSTAEHTKQI